MNFGERNVCGRSAPLFSREGFGTNSLSQNLTVLPAPSGREPLARPQVFCFSRKAPAREYPFRLAASRQATFPKGTAFGGGGKVSGIAQRRPLGGAGCERSEQTEGVLGLTACALSVKAYGFASSPKGRAKSTTGNFLIMPNTLATNVTAWLSLRESWRGSA